MSARPKKEWWTAAELAEAGLPDLPNTVRAIQLLANRMNWQAQATRARRRKGRGGGWEYHWTLLPVRARNALMATALSEPAEPQDDTRPDRNAAWQWFDGLPDAPKAVARERLEAIQAVEALESAGLIRALAVDDVARMRDVSGRTIWNWLSMIDGVRTDDRLPYLAPRHRAGARKSRRTPVDPDFIRFIKSDYLRLSQPSLTSCYDRAVRVAEDQGWEVAPLHTVRRWLKDNVSATTLVFLRKGVDALKRLYPPQERDKSALHALEAVNGDFHRFDVFVRFPAGAAGQREEIVRPQMVSFQDIYSGKLLAWRVDRTANSHAVQLCIGDMIDSWGIPDKVLLDNGREFAAKMITGGAPTRFRFKVREDDMPGLLTSMGCEISWATPYSGQSKPIERAFRDLCDRVAKHPAFEGAYTGNRPDAKPENYGSRAIPLDQFLEVLETEMRAHNARPDRRSEVAYGRSFDAVFEESYQTAPIRKATAEQRRLWLLGAEGIQANRHDGRISFMGNRYWDAWMAGIAGQKVVIRFDRAALWDGIHVYALAGQYLGFAGCIEKAGFFDMDDARAHSRNRSAYVKAQRAAADALDLMKPADVAASLTRLEPAEASRPQATVVRPVFNAPRAAETPEQTPAEAAQQTAIIADLASRQARPAEEDGRAVYARALELERRLEAGQQLTKDQQVWLHGYQQTPDYRTWKAMVEDFGEDVLSG